MTTSKPLGIYVHIPFCVQKCGYCGFISYGDNNAERMLAYENALICEIRERANELAYMTSDSNYKKYYVNSIFVGGGTPSILPSSSISRIMSELRDGFYLTDDCEITIESNPGTLTAEKLAVYKDCGVNRLSMGFQSLEDPLLKTLGRIHSKDECIQAFNLARQAGFSNINIDLMFGIPGQDINMWHNTLKSVIELFPEHVSFYSLQFEEGTPFYNELKSGKMIETDELIDRNMYHQAIKLLDQAGYNHYEISNSARQGFQCRHNLKYWSMDEYLGLGLAAHSYLTSSNEDNGESIDELTTIKERHIRRNNAEDIEKYITAALTGAQLKNEYENTIKDEMAEFVFTGLRKIDGIKLDDFEKRFGMSFNSKYSKAVKKLKAAQLLTVDEAQNRAFLTKLGLDVSNRVFVEFV